MFFVVRKKLIILLYAKILKKTNTLAYSESKAFPTIGVILLGGISDKISRVPMHTSAGFAYEGLESEICVNTRVYVNRGKPEGHINGGRVQYSATGRSPFVLLNHYRESILKRLGLNGEGLSISFQSTNVGVLSGSSDAGAAAMGSSVYDMNGGIADMASFENELRSISESVGRSLHGGLTVTWADGKTAKTERLLGPESFKDYAIIGCRFNVERNPSDRIHENAVTSSEYPKRIESTLNKAKELVKLAEDKDIEGIFEIGHYDTSEYHRLNESVGVRVITPRMRKLMDIVDEKRKSAWLSYIVTGGSNVFVITERKNLREYVDEFVDNCDGISLLKVADKAHVTLRSYP